MPAFREISYEDLEKENKELRQRLEAYEKKEAKENKIPWWKFWVKPPPPPQWSGWFVNAYSGSRIYKADGGLEYHILVLHRERGEETEYREFVRIPGDPNWYVKTNGRQASGTPDYPTVDFDFFFSSSQRAIKLKEVLGTPSHSNEEPKKSLSN